MSFASSSSSLFASSRMMCSTRLTMLPMASSASRVPHLETLWFHRYPDHGSSSCSCHINMGVCDLTHWASGLHPVTGVADFVD